MYREQLLRLVADASARRQYCRRCGKPIVWRTTPTGASVPLNADALPRMTDQHPETYVRYELFDRADVHPRECKKVRRDGEPALERQFAAAGDR